MRAGVTVKAERELDCKTQSYKGAPAGRDPDWTGSSSNVLDFVLHRREQLGGKASGWEGERYSTPLQAAKLVVAER